MRTSRLVLGLLGAAVTSAAAAALGERRLVRAMAGVAAPDGWVSPRFPVATELMVPTDDGAELRVAVAGPADGEPVVLVHGLTSNHDDWGPVARRLVEVGYRVVGINQRGHGGSTVGRDGFSGQRLGADLGQTLSALDLSDVTLVGHSMGGVAAMALMLEAAETGADRVGRLVLVATLADGGRVDRRLGLRLAQHPQTVVTRHPVHGAVAARMGFGTTPSAAMAADWLASLHRCPDATRAGAARGLLAWDVRELLGRIDVPTRVICGTRDLATRLSENRRLASAIPGAELVVVPGAGHMVIWEAPELIVETIASLRAPGLSLDAP